MLQSCTALRPHPPVLWTGNTGAAGLIGTYLINQRLLEHGLKDILEKIVLTDVFDSIVNTHILDIGGTGVLCEHGRRTSVPHGAGHPETEMELTDRSGTALHKFL